MAAPVSFKRLLGRRTYRACDSSSNDGLTTHLGYVSAMPQRVDIINRPWSTVPSTLVKALTIAIETDKISVCCSAAVCECLVVTNEYPAMSVSGIWIYVCAIAVAAASNEDHNRGGECEKK